MRARTVNKKVAYVFDFDDTLVKTDAKIHVYVNNKKIKSLTPAEYNFYEQKPNETLDFRDFSDPRIIMSGKKYKMWPVIENISNARKMGKSTSDIFILTGRSPKSQLAIYNFLKRNKIDIELNNVITVGNDDGINISIAEEKRKVLELMSNDYDEINFFDDSTDNINITNNIPGVRTRLIEKYKINKNYESMSILRV